MKLTLASLTFMVALSGCATQVLQTEPQKSYVLGQSLTAPVGGRLLKIQRGKLETVRRWVGLLNSSDGWKTELRYSDNFVNGELIYGGISGQTIEIAYREYRGTLAAPAFFQNLKYDLGASKSIVFQNFRIDVRNATNVGIDAVLVSD